MLYASESYQYHSFEWFINLFIKKFKIYPHIHELANHDKYYTVKVLDYLKSHDFALDISHTEIESSPRNDDFDTTIRFFKKITPSVLNNNISENTPHCEEEKIYIFFPTRERNKKSYVYNINFLYHPSQKNNILNMIEDIKKFRKRREKRKIVSNINVIVSSNRGLDLIEYDIKDTKIDVNVNYNDDFAEIHDIIVNKLNEDDKGIVILHGTPGTGKTSYIRYLTSILKKKVIFMPTNMTACLSTPEFFTFMLEHGKDSILLIEDGETVLKSRQAGESSSVSNLLNISDGILGDVLRCQIIVTFNCNLTEIDKALYRKGRIIAKYEFQKLAVEKAKILAENLNKNPDEITEDMTLADIYNKEDKSFNQEIRKNGIGFGS